MVRKCEYDFLTWTSFPSSIKLINDEPERWVNTPKSPPIKVTPRATIRLEVNAKAENMQFESGVCVDGWNGREWVRVAPLWRVLLLPTGTYDWFKATKEFTIPSGITSIRVWLAGTWGTPGIPGITWFDDLKIYMDDKLIYADDFSNWNPYLGAGFGALAGLATGYYFKPLGPVASEVVLGLAGAGLGGVVGYLTAKP